jgi:hypothetical protein
MPTGIKVEISGPLLERGNPIIKKWAVRFVKILLDKGEDRLNDVLRPRPAGVFLSVSQARAKGLEPSTGNYRRNIKKPPLQGLTGRLHDNGVHYGPWLEGTSPRNTANFRGYGSYRKTRDWLNQNKDKVGDALKHKIIRELIG